MEGVFHGHVSSLQILLRKAIIPSDFDSYSFEAKMLKDDGYCITFTKTVQLL